MAAYAPSKARLDTLPVGLPVPAHGCRSETGTPRWFRICSAKPHPGSRGIPSTLFLGENGGRLRRSNFRRATHWAATARKVGLPAEFHFHDLRHTGNQLAAEAGAMTEELMRRMGHSTVRAAMRY
jgi:integrase